MRGVSFDAMPGVAGGVLGLVPAQARGMGRLVPAALHVGLGVVEGAAFVAAARLPAVAIGGGHVVVRDVRVVVIAGLVVLAPVGVLGGRVDRLGDALAGE